MSTYIASLIGQPPPRPPNVYLSTGERNPERDIWHDANPEEAERQAKEWREWFQKEQDIISRAISGSDAPVEDVLSALGFADEIEKGKTVYSRYPQEEADRLRKEAFVRAKSHYEVDPGSGLYFSTNQGTGPTGDPSTWSFYDSNGKLVNISPQDLDRLRRERGMSSSFDPSQLGGAFGLAGSRPVSPGSTGIPQTSQAAANTRPYLNVDNPSSYSGYRSYIGREEDPAKVANQSQADSAFGLYNRGIPGLQPVNAIAGLNSPGYGYYRPTTGYGY